MWFILINASFAKISIIITNNQFSGEMRESERFINVHQNIYINENVYEYELACV